MIHFQANNLPPITNEEMLRIYETIKTPHKLGPVIKWDNDFTDSPTVFRQEDRFWMYFIAVSKDCSTSGYETHLAKS